MVAIFTSVLSTSLTVSVLTSEIKLYSSKVCFYLSSLRELFIMLSGENFVRENEANVKNLRLVKLSKDNEIRYCYS